MALKYYIFTQNNSGGSFDEIEGKRDLLIQAKNSEEANNIAQSLGVYFNGVEDGGDCDCCGDRWYPTSENNTVENIDIEYYSDYLIYDENYLKIKEYRKDFEKLIK